MLILAAALLTATSGVSSSAQSLPDAPMIIKAEIRPTKRHNFNRADFAIYAGVVAYRTADYFTTEAVLHTRGGYEAELPQCFVASKPGFVAYSLGMAGLEIGASIYLHKHGHPKLARFADVLSISAGAATDLHNVQVVNNAWAKARRVR